MRRVVGAASSQGLFVPLNKHGVGRGIVRTPQLLNQGLDQPHELHSRGAIRRAPSSASRSITAATATRSSPTPFNSRSVRGRFRRLGIVHHRFLLHDGFGFGGIDVALRVGNTNRRLNVRGGPTHRLRSESVAVALVASTIFTFHGDVVLVLCGDVLVFPTVEPTRRPGNCRVVARRE